MKSIVVVQHKPHHHSSLPLFNQMTARHYEGLQNGLTNITLYFLSHFKQCHFPSSRQFRIGPPIFIHTYIHTYIYIYIYIYIISLIILRRLWQFATFPYILAVRRAAKPLKKNLSFTSTLSISTVSTSEYIYIYIYIYKYFKRKKDAKGKM